MNLQSIGTWYTSCHSRDMRTLISNSITIIVAPGRLSNTTDIKNINQSEKLENRTTQSEMKNKRNVSNISSINASSDKNQIRNKTTEKE